MTREIFSIHSLRRNGSRGGSKTAATSKMECFVIIVNGFQPLTIITKCSILDVAAVLDLPLILILIFISVFILKWNNITRSLNILGMNKLDIGYCILSNIQTLLSTSHFQIKTCSFKCTSKFKYIYKKLKSFKTH